MALGEKKNKKNCTFVPFFIMCRLCGPTFLLQLGNDGVFPPDHGPEDTTESGQTFTAIRHQPTGSCDSPVVEVHDSLDGVPASRGDVSLEPGEQRCDDIHAVLPPLPVNTQIKTMIQKYQTYFSRSSGVQKVMEGTYLCARMILSMMASPILL